MTNRHRPNIRLLQVYLHDQLAGVITEVAPNRTVFSFDRDYIDDYNRPTLSLSFKSQTGTLMTEFRQHHMALDPFFSNLLPEGHLRTYLAERAHVHEKHEFYLLAALGQDLPGALRITPSDPELFTGIEDILNEETSDPRNGTQPLRFSLAGVQLKFSATTSTEKRGGLTIPTRGVGGEWIVKLPSSQYPGVPENEYSMMALARDVGIQVPEFKLVDTSSISGLPEGIEALTGQAYAVERFDRSPGGPVHIEDMAQVFNKYPDEKYDKASVRRIAKFLAAETPSETQQEFIRRVTFSVLIGNGDMHLKNWSVLYPDRRTPILSPAYDLVSTIPYLQERTFALAFDRLKNFTDFTQGEMATVCRKALLPERQTMTTIRTTIDQFMTSWEEKKTSLPMHSDVRTAIDRHLGQLPALKRDFR